MHGKRHHKNISPIRRKIMASRRRYFANISNIKANKRFNYQIASIDSTNKSQMLNKSKYRTPKQGTAKFKQSANRSSKTRKRRWNNSRKTELDDNDDSVTLTSVQQLNTNDDTPTTSTATRSPPFKKFRDNSHFAYQRFNSTNKPLSTTQMLTRKLLRSIKRREWLYRPTKSNSLKRRLNFANNEASNKMVTVPGNKPQAKRNSRDTLEEGELRSEREQSMNNSNVVSDDDCIYIEPQIDHINIIDDDAPVESQSPATSSSSSGRKQLTSTPYQKPSSAKLNKSTTLPLYFEDVSKTSWFESIKSDDTFCNYTKLNMLGSNSLVNRKNDSPKTVVDNVDDDDDDDVILLTDSSTNVTLKPSQPKRPKSTKQEDDSVIFISETNPKTTNDFIALETDNESVKSTLKSARNPFTPPKSKNTPIKPNELFTKSEKKQLDAYNDNAYNPTAGQQTLSKKRMVIIDGSNVAFKHGLDQAFSVKGIKISIDYFEKMGHEVKAVVPQYRLKKPNSSDNDMLTQLHKAGKIVITPSKNLPGKSSTSYDDRFILQLACELDAAVISNDNYRDLIHENTAFKKLIENRVIGYTWCNDIFILPKDPYGRWGPTLHSILNRA